jgi:hypothetical protein
VMNMKRITRCIGCVIVMHLTRPTSDPHWVDGKNFEFLSYEIMYVLCAILEV